MPILPPVNQTFTANTAAFMAGVDEMLAGLDRLAVKLDELGITAQDFTAAQAAKAGELAASFDPVLAQIAAVQTAYDEMAVNQGLAVDKMMVKNEELAASSRGAGAGAAAGAAETDAGAAAASGGALGGITKTALLGVGAAMVYGVAMAGKYQQAITQLNTQAGVSKDKLAGLQQGVLQLASQVGFSPDSLAESLYHVESNFESMHIKGFNALQVTKIAAEGAKVGQANLVDVTNALTAAVASGIPGVQNYSQAMGALNATVGAGDMHMQDLADAFGTGMVAVVKGYGLSLKDVGAALDVFGDNNIRGAKAGTDLRMAVQALAVPAKAGKDQLAQWGFTADRFASDMRHGGLLSALEDLQGMFKKNGITATEQGQYITDMFGKRAGVGLAVLMDQMDRMKSKYPAITAGANDFGNAWKTQQQTVSQQWHNMLAGLDALVISFGEKLLPIVTKVIGWIAKFFGFLERHGELAAFAGAIIAVAVAFEVVSKAGIAFDAVMDANPVMLVIMAIIALAAGLYELYKHFKVVRDIVGDVGRFFKTAWEEAVHLAGAVINWFVNGPLAFIRQQIAVFRQFWEQNHLEIMRIVRAVWAFISMWVKFEWDVLMAILRQGLNLLLTVWRVVWDTIRIVVKTVWDVIATVIRAAIRIVLDVIRIALDVLQGHWGAAWNALKDLVSTALHAAINIATTVLKGAVSLIYNLGRDIIMGLIHGVESMFGSVGSIFGNLASHALGVFKSVLHIFSPSQVFHDQGMQIAQGLANGIGAGKSLVTASMQKLAGGTALGLAGGVGGLAAGAGGGGGVGTQIVMHPGALQVNGFVGNEQQLTQQLYLLMQKGALQFSRRNPTNGLNLSAARP